MCTERATGFIRTRGHCSIVEWISPFQTGLCSRNWLSGKRVYRIKDLESSPWKSWCIPFKKPETQPAPQSLRILLSSNSSTVCGNVFRIWGAPPLTWTWDPVNYFTRKALHHTCHTITEDSGTSVLEDDVWAGLLVCTAGDIL